MVSPRFARGVALVIGHCSLICCVLCHKNVRDVLRCVLSSGATVMVVVSGW